jgi:chromate transporter
VLGASFALHVLWPAGLGGCFETFAALLCVAATVALFRFKVGIIPVIGGCAVVGLSYRPLLRLG